MRIMVQSKTTVQVVLFIFVLTVISGCVSSENETTGTEMLAVSRSLLSIEADENRTIEVVSLAANGTETDWIATGDSCVIVQESSIEEFSFNATCSGTVTVTGDTGLSREIEVQVFDPLTMDIGDGLLLGFTNKFNWIWDDDGSGAANDGEFYQASLPEGWHRLGTLMSQRGNSGPGNAMAILKSTGEDQLASPTNYRWIWDDKESGGDHDGSVWLPICPDEYVSMGVVGVDGYSKPSLNLVKCVHEKYTLRGNIGSYVWADQGSGAIKDVKIWRVGYPTILSGNEERIPLLTGTSVACKYYTVQNCPADVRAAANVLMIPKEVIERADNQAEDVRLTEPLPLDTTFPRYFSAVRLPLVLVPGAASPIQIRDNIDTAPFVTVYRTESYKSIDIIDNRQGSEPVIDTWDVSVGFEESATKTFSQLVGITVTAGGEVSFMGLGSVSDSISLTAEFKWTQSSTYTSNQEVTKTRQFTIPAGAYGQIVQITTGFVAENPYTGTIIGQVYGDSLVIKYLEYKP
jgi:hypothetical protein